MTFIEVLFAVIILGIGFIMIAAIFPVALQQTQSNVDETAAAGLVRGALSTIIGVDLRSYSPLSALPPPSPPPVSGAPPQMMSFRDGDPTLNLWYALRASFISTADPRYGCVGFYQWTQGTPYAKVVIIAVRCRSNTNYDQYHDVNRWMNGSSNDLAGIPPASPTPPATLEGHQVNFSISQDQNGLTYSATFTGNYTGCVAPQAYLVVQNDTTNNGLSNGYVFRIGNPNMTAGGSTWELVPDDDLTGLFDQQFNQVTTINGTGYVVGQGYVDRTNPTEGYDGGAQDIMAYTSFISMN